MKNYVLAISISFENSVDGFKYWKTPLDCEFQEGYYSCTFRLKVKRL